jgi:hypothetical protein
MRWRSAPLTGKAFYLTAQKATKQPHKKRKTGYQKSFDKQAYIACAEGGFTNEQLRKLFDVKQYKTIWNWRNANPSFDEAITRGKDEFNQDKAERAPQGF